MEASAPPHLRDQLRQIEIELDLGVYQPGPWAAFLREARRRPLSERAQVASDVSRVSDKLHQRTPRRTLSYPLAIALEGGIASTGALLLLNGLRQQSNWQLFAAAGALTFSMQPLVKTTVGSLLGIRYSYAYIQGAEPRFKMRYGTYLAAPRWKRIAVQLAGTVGSPLALGLVGTLAGPRQRSVQRVCNGLAALLASAQVGLFAAGVAGVRKLGGREQVAMTSGGAAGAELREAIRE
jgi:hypothetical protein